MTRASSSQLDCTETPPPAHRCGRYKLRRGLHLRHELVRGLRDVAVVPLRRHFHDLLLQQRGVDKTGAHHVARDIHLRRLLRHEFGVPDHGVLAGDVGCLARVTHQAQDGGSIHDAAPFVLLHGEHRIQAHIDDVVLVFHGKLVCAADVLHPGTVHQSVNATQLHLHGLHHRSQ